jgi:PrcB C-terminal
MRTFLSIFVFVSVLAVAFSQGRADVPFQVIDRGTNSGEVEQGVKVLRTERAFEEFLKNQGEEKTKRMLKMVDWQTEQAVIVFGGQQNSGGFSVDVKRIASVDIQRLVVEAKLNRPSPNQGVTLALTTPYIILKMQRQVAAIKVKFLAD